MYYIFLIIICANFSAHGMEEGNSGKPILRPVSAQKSILSDNVALSIHSPKYKLDELLTESKGSCKINKLSVKTHETYVGMMSDDDLKLYIKKYKLHPELESYIEDFKHKSRWSLYEEEYKARNQECILENCTKKLPSLFIRSKLWCNSRERSHNYVHGLLQYVKKNGVWDVNGSLEKLENIHQIRIYILEQPHIKQLMCEKSILRQQGIIGKAIHWLSSKMYPTQPETTNKISREKSDVLLSNEICFSLNTMLPKILTIKDQFQGDRKKREREKLITPFIDVSEIETMIMESDEGKKYIDEILEYVACEDNPSYGKSVYPGLKVYDQLTLNKIQDVQNNELTRYVNEYIKLKVNQSRLRMAKKKFQEIKDKVMETLSRKKDEKKVLRLSKMGAIQVFPNTTNLTEEQKGRIVKLKQYQIGKTWLGYLWATITLPLKWFYKT